MRKLTLLLIAFSLFFSSGNSLFGLFEDRPQFLIIEDDANIGVCDLNDVTCTSLQNNQVIVFNSGTGLWENATQAGGGGGGRTYTGIAPITVDNDVNEVGLNVGPTDDWNGTFDGLDANEFTLDRAYDQESGQQRVINVDDGDINFSAIGNNVLVTLDGSSNFRIDSPTTSGLFIAEGNLTQSTIRIPFQKVFGVNEVNISDFSAYEINIDTIGGGGQFSVLVDDILVFTIGAAPITIGPPFNEDRFFVTSETWLPLDDANQDLGATDIRWRDLYLSGTIKGQGTGGASAFTFDLSGGSGNFDTIGDVNSFDLLVRGDVNNNSSTSDANFNRVEADFYFGDGSGLTNVGGGISEADGNALYVKLNPTTGQVINFPFDLNHLDGNTFFGRTELIGQTDDTILIIRQFEGMVSNVLEILSSTGFPLFTILSNGGVDINHTSTQNDEVALNIRVDAQGFSDIVGLEIDYITRNLSFENQQQGMIFGIDQSQATGGEFIGYQIVPTEGDANIIAVETGILVHPLRQLSGSFSDMNSAFVAGVDRRAEFIDPDSNIAMFVNQDDNITIGSQTKFQAIEFLLATPAGGAGIKPIFEHSVSPVGTFATFNPADPTRGMRQNGVIIFDNELIPSWEVGANNEFIIRITRTQNNIPTIPVEQKVQIASATEYFWNKDGSIFVKDINASLVTLTQDLNFVDSSGVPTGSWDNDANRICLGFNCQMFYDWNGTAGIIGTR